MHLKKTHANTQNTSKLRKHNQIENTCAANTHNATKFRKVLLILTTQPNSENCTCFNLIFAIQVTHQNPNLDSLMCELFPILKYFLLCN